MFVLNRWLREFPLSVFTNRFEPKQLMDAIVLQNLSLFVFCRKPSTSTGNNGRSNTGKLLNLTECTRNKKDGFHYYCSNILGEALLKRWGFLLTDPVKSRNC